MYRLLLERIEDSGKQTIGRLFLLDKNSFIKFSCCTVELPYLNNAPNISCIPIGKYNVIKRTSEKYKQHLHILDVENRSYILIHNANFHWQLRGCVAVGDDFQYIDSDNEIDVTSSKKTMKKLMLAIKETEQETLELEVVNLWDF